MEATHHPFPIFKGVLHSLVNNDVYELWECKKSEFLDCDGTVFNAALFVVGTFDGYEADGHPLGKQRTLYHLKTSHLLKGLGRSYLFVICALTSCGRHSAKITRDLREKYFYKFIEEEIANKIFDINIRGLILNKAKRKMNELMQITIIMMMTKSCSNPIYFQFVMDLIM